MCCPYFEPAEPRATLGDTRSAMLPLGGMWQGACRADAGGMAPGDALCNRGYARGSCRRFPAVDGPDAVRFAIARDSGHLAIRYSLERNHHPFEHGEIDPDALPDTLLTRQAHAYLAVYRERTSEAQRA